VAKSRIVNFRKPLDAQGNPLPSPAPKPGWDLKGLQARWRALSTLQIALIVSLAVHAGLLTVRFVDPEGFNRILQDTPLEVVLVNASSAQKPVKAQVIAQRNLSGGGDAAAGKATSPLPPALMTESGDAAETARKQIEQMQDQQMQLLALVKRELATFSPPDPQANEGKPMNTADEERRRQLLQLLAQIEKRVNEENARPRRRYVSPAAREGVHAVYYDSLRQKIEELGTHNFPESNGRKLYGELTMLVSVDSLGRVVDTEIVTSSGNRLLDKRAMLIARGAGPFGGFTPAMRAQFDQLVFVSRFRFTRDEGLKTAMEDASTQKQNAER
jgi:periplasmic protein TonB